MHLPPLDSPLHLLAPLCQSGQIRKKAPTWVSSSFAAGASASAVLHGSAASSISLMLSKKPILITYPMDWLLNGRRCSSRDESGRSGKILVGEPILRKLGIEGV
jgi:hypothetical protein